MKIRLSHPFKCEDVTRQFSGLHEWIVNAQEGDSDIWLVHENLAYPRENGEAGAAVLVITEPPMQKLYSRAFIQQFDAVISAVPYAGAKSQILWSQCYPWHVGWDKLRGLASENQAQSYASLKAKPLPQKNRQISVVCSSDTRLPGHQQRLAFVKTLKRLLGDQLEWFGRGVRPVADKWEALSPYNFHLCLENSSIPHYWTEKIGDAFLAGCFPIYWGAPNIRDYFDPLGLETINIAERDQAVSRIITLLDRGITNEQRRAVACNRDRVMDMYSYDATAQFLGDLLSRHPRRLIHLTSQSGFRTARLRLMEKIQRFPSRLYYEAASKLR